MKKQKWKVWITIAFVAVAALLYGADRLYQSESLAENVKNAEDAESTAMCITQAESGVSEKFVMKTFSDTLFSTVADEGEEKPQEPSGSEENADAQSTHAEDTGIESAGREKNTDAQNMGAENADADVWWVYVCGEVQNPGVYALEKSSRVVDAIEAAGGFTEQAAAAYWNLAEVLKDGMKIAVPSIEEAAGDPYGVQNVGRMAAASGNAGNTVETAPVLVDLNTADAALLQTLPGIGEAKAADIIAYRQEHGGFRSIEEIMNIAGIKEAVFQKIKDRITVS
ncbi:MAG: ComEA family DNA-binding protein [bacterium]|nr:ComEA family DNA-binding protein [bacterium]